MYSKYITVLRMLLLGFYKSFLFRETQLRAHCLYLDPDSYSEKAVASPVGYAASFDLAGHERKNQRKKNRQATKPDRSIKKFPASEERRVRSCVVRIRMRCHFLGDVPRRLEAGHDPATDPASRWSTQVGDGQCHE